MKFNFKIQQYQTDAVEAVARVFNGQGLAESVGYRRDIGVQEEKEQLSLDSYDEINDIGYKNEVIQLSDDQLLKNIQDIFFFFVIITYFKYNLYFTIFN